MKKEGKEQKGQKKNLSLVWQGTSAMYNEIICIQSISVIYSQNLFPPKGLIS